MGLLPRMNTDCKKSDNSNCRKLQRLDLYLAPLDGAAGGSFVKVAKLEGNMAFRKLAVLDIHGLDPIQHDYKLRTSGRYLVGVPLAAGLGVGRYLRDIGDGPSPVTRVRPLVVYIHLVGTLTADVFGIGIANKNTAIRGVIRPELGSDLEVLV